jgi:hypothetical protein
LKYLKGLSTALPQLSQLEGEYRPRFGELNLGDVNTSLFGTSTQPGIIGMGGQATQASQQQIEAARRAELTGATGRTGDVLGLLGMIDPATQRIAGQSAQMADQRFAAAQGLNVQEKRMADQAARESFAARGRVNDNASVAAEILGREEIMAAKRAEAMQTGQQAAQLNQQFTSPALGILMGTPVSTALGQDYLNAGRQAIGAATPQLIDTGAGISLGQQQASNLASWQQNQQAAKQAQNSQYLQIASALASAAMSYSDKRVKKDIKKVGKTDAGLPIYTYKYKGDDRTQMGVMAQDLEKSKPGAVKTVGGIKMVDYSKI